MADGSWVIVQLKEGENVKVSKIVPAIYEKTFNALLEEINKETNLKENGTPRVFVKAEGKDISHEVQIDMPISICKAFSCNVTVFLFAREERSDKESLTKTRTQKGRLFIERFNNKTFVSKYSY